jgi:putative oxidoreductase
MQIHALRERLLRLTDTLSFLAPALLRLTLGLVFIRTGWGKLQDLGQVTEMFTGLGIPLPALNARVASLTEFVGGILLLIGLGARLVALPMAFTMLVAIVTAQREEVETVVDLVALEEWSYLVMFLVIALRGPGLLSLDHWIGRRLFRRPDPNLPASAGS